MVEIAPLSAPVDAVVRVPGSKSLTNRALIAAGLASGRSVLEGALFSDDTLFMVDALRQLGIGVETEPRAGLMLIDGCNGRIPAAEAHVYVGNSGTTSRFLPPLMALGHGRFVLDGNPRMRERPISPLVTALNAIGGQVLGVRVPITVLGNGLRGGEVRLPGHISSQYVSGLLLSAPYMREGLTVVVDGRLVSRPYVDITLDVMRAFGVNAEAEDYRRFSVPHEPDGYRGTIYPVEPDASAASYFFAAAAICGGRVTVEGLGTGSRQGDMGFVRLLERMGCEVGVGDRSTTVVRAPGTRLEGIDVDMRDVSDTAQTLAVVASFATSPTRIRGIGFVRGKETDRVGAVVTELHRLGVPAEEDDDGLTIPPVRPRRGVVRTYDDHRMAMSFALVGLAVRGIEIQDPACVAKTFPTFFEALEGLGRRTGPPGSRPGEDEVVDD